MYAVNLGNVLQIIGAHQATITADVLSSAIDLNDYEGQLAAILKTPGSTGNANNTLDVTIHHADTSGGSYTAASGAAFTQVGYNAAGEEKIVLNKGALKRWVKFNFDVTGTSPSYACAALLLGAKKNPA